MPNKTIKKSTTTKATQKLNTLYKILKPYNKVVLAFSGGVDSTFLLAALCNKPERKVIAVTALSPTYPEHQRAEAKKLIAGFNAEYREIETDEINLPGFRDNPPDRCYHCKHELFSMIEKIRAKEKYDIMVDGSNHDDLSDYRPGMKALKELNVRSPLQEAMLSKTEIRMLSKQMKLTTWDKPAFACLSSRFPYGTQITADALKKIDRCESFLTKKFKGHIRVRYYDSLVRIEVETKLIPQVIKQRDEIVKYFKKQGFAYTCIDLEGYRTGSMNEVL